MWGGWECVCCVYTIEKKPMNLCEYDTEERDHWVGVGVSVVMMSVTL